MRASPLEWAWTVVALFGLFFSGWLMLNGWRDWNAVEYAIRVVPPRARRWGPRYWVAYSAVISNGLLCLVWTGFMLIGLIAMQYPPPPPTTDQHVSNQWSGWILIGMEFLLMSVQGWHLYVRMKLEQANERHLAAFSAEQSE
jgi:hypothetical protein